MKNEENKKVQEKCLLQTIDELGRGSKLLWIAFFVSAISSLLKSLHTMSYVFIAEIPEHWCHIPELLDANWTATQAQNISTVDNCLKYDYNYAYLARLDYKDAGKYVEDLKFNTSLVPCSSFVFDKSKKSTIVNEWSLVCDRQLYRANTYFTYSLGKLLGTGILGVYADKNGRRKALIISLTLQTIAVPLTSIIPWFWGYILCELLIGLSVAAMYSSAYTIVSEIANKNKMKILGIVSDTLNPAGVYLLIIISYYIKNWRNLQMALSLFTIPAIILVWFVEESPRWLIALNRHNKAQKIIEKYRKITFTPDFITTSIPLTSIPIDHSITEKKHQKSFAERFLGNSRILFTDPIYRKKILIMYFSFFVCVMVGYYLIFNVDNFKINRYIFMAATATTELVSLLTVSIVLRYISSQKITIILYWIASICMLSMVAIPKDNIYLTIELTVISKFCLSSTFTTNMLFSLKLFPSSVRNSALGSCILMAQVGSMSSPYLVDFLGKVAPWSPSVLCGGALFIAGLLCCIVPV
ncbi:organic cation transporter protein-like [Cotesia glomerata]|uniref:organic cation transporter protein-like n=1 Tax=Cotesia glomerata TaxID=32391 RepID=UPI001D02CBB8|nr:organic cation transporter protein-like [Cotesia glomerata]